MNPSTVFVIVHGADGSIVSFYELARLLNIPVIAIRYIPSLVESCQTIEQFAAIYLDHFLKCYPTVSYILAGHSFGGLVALEMAVLAHAQGKKNVPVFLLDPNLPLAMRNYQAERLLELRVLATIVIPQHMIAKYDIDHCDESELLNLLSRCLKPNRIEEILSARKHCLAALSQYSYRDHPGLFAHMIHASDKLEFDFIDQETKCITTGSMVSGNHFTMLNSPHAGDLAAIINSHLGRYV